MIRYIIFNQIRDKIVVALQSYARAGIILERSIQKSFRILGIDYADALLLGWHNKHPRMKLIYRALKLQDRDIIRSIGMSGHNRKEFGDLAQTGDTVIDYFMIRYNAVHSGAEKDVFPFLPEKQTPGVLIYTSTCWGKLLKQKKMPSGETALTASECYRFVLSNPNVDICLSGPKNEKHVDDAGKTLGESPLSEEELERIKRIGDHIYGKKRL